MLITSKRNFGSQDKCCKRDIKELNKDLKTEKNVPQIAPGGEVTYNNIITALDNWRKQENCLTVVLNMANDTEKTNGP